MPQGAATFQLDVNPNRPTKVLAEREAFAAVSAVAAMPLLQACARRWSSCVAANWDHG